MFNLALIVGSTRPNRFADKVVDWVVPSGAKRTDFRLETLDLRDHVLPFFEEPVPPSMNRGMYSNPAAQEWCRQIARFDAFIVTVAEYNHGPTAVLKNAFDSAFLEWNNKPIAFIGYGGVGGARAIEQLRGCAIELQMAPIKAEVNINRDVYLGVALQQRSLASYDYLETSLNALFDQLGWWALALRAARQG